MTQHAAVRYIICKFSSAMTAGMTTMRMKSLYLPLSYKSQKKLLAYFHFVFLSILSTILCGKHWRCGCLHIFWASQAEGCCFPSWCVNDSSLSVHLSSERQVLPKKPIFRWLMEASQQMKRLGEWKEKSGSKRKKANLINTCGNSEAKTLIKTGLNMFKM